MKIDVFPHILPPRFKDALVKRAPAGFRQSVWHKYLDVLPTLWDLDRRFRIMDRFEGLAQILTLASPAIETLFDSKYSPEFARIANDEMAELVAKYPDRFPAAVASLPMNNLDAALQELDRTIRKLGMKGIQLETSIDGKPLDSPEFMAIHEKMAGYDLPIWVHPKREREGADYSSEKESKYLISSLFGREYETAAFMTRMVFSGVFEKYPGLKIITHHFGGMVSFLERRIDGLYDLHGQLLGKKYTQNLTKRPIDYYHLFYCDTAYGSAPGLMCVASFFGADHVLFATDMPYDNEQGERKIRETIKSIEGMGIAELDKKKIFEENIRRLLRL
ncbi:MAG: amidohydrolase family protein [Thermodesulfobacteriota bacterium]